MAAQVSRGLELQGPLPMILAKAYEDETLSSAHVFEWYKRFSEGRSSEKDDEPAEHPMSGITDQNITKIRDMNGFPFTSVSSDC
ncbi:hypothetical protein TNCV_448191 [Trichonephila clavipes]|nr:hypothetical protein TNCV_448191 [Trichonephila clavipes]